MKALFKFIIYSLILSILLSVLYTRFISKDTIDFFGFRCLRVLTGSMSPTINAGENIIIKRCKEYKVGDIVTYITKDNYLVTHRIISIDSEMYYTKGDFNNTPDLEPISMNQIYGKVIYHYKPIFSNTMFSFAKYINSSKIKTISRIAKPVFSVTGDKEIAIEKYGSIHDYSFSVRNYNESQISEVDLSYNIELIADDSINYQLFYDNEEIDLQQTFKLSHNEEQEHSYMLRIEAPEDYEGTVKVNIYAYQEEV